MAEVARQGNKLNVFISYSRDDLDFSDQLDAAVRLTGFHTTLDRHGISGGEDWKRRLGNLIRDADTVAFVLSPSSARSEICAWEVAEATKLGKRIIPVLCRPLADASPPPQLADLNYIFFYPEPKSPGSGFGSGLTRLVAALNTDLEWLREHTRYLQRATEWDAGGRPANRLLSGADIVTAKAWAARRPNEAPEPTPLHLDFIRESENWETQQQNEERKRLQEMARAQEERANALAETDAAQKREAEASRRAEAEARRAAEEAIRAATASRTVAKRTMAGLAVALVLAAIAGVAGFYAFNQKQTAIAQTQVAQQALRVAVAWEYTEKDPSVSAAFLREAKEPRNIRGWRGATAKTLEILHATSKVGLQGHADKILSANFSPDGARVVTASWDNTARIWDGKTGAEIAVLKGHTSVVTSASFSTDGTRIVTGSADNTVRIWDANTGAAIRVFMGHTNEVTSVSSSPDGRQILTTSDGSARIWEVATGRMFLALDSAGVSSAAFSPDGNRIVTASNDKTARLWSARNGAEIAILRGHTADLTSATFSPDTRRIITASRDGTARLWDAEAGAEIAAFVGHAGNLSSAAFSPDGARIVTASNDKTARLWDARSGRLIYLFRHPGEVWAANFSPDGRYVATASTDGKARLWTMSGLLDSVFNVSASGLVSADYSPDGSRLVAVSQDGMAQILTLLPEIEGLQAQLWHRSPACPDAQTREVLLGQSNVEAENDHIACQLQIQKLGKL